MPELPEVETTRKGIQPHIENQMITRIVIRQHQLRWKVPSTLPQQLRNKKVDDVMRRGKYLLFKIDCGTLVLHLGMSGSLRILTKATPPQKHDHIDIEFANKKILRFTDPRRFGAMLWMNNNDHPLLAKLGPEPLTKDFSAKYLVRLAQNKIVAIKSFIMDSKIVVGVGNIYAAEALFLSKIDPAKPAKTLSQEQMERLVKAIKRILRQAIQQGGTTLKDFVNSEGKPGYFVNKLKVYGRDGLPCVTCHEPLSSMRIGQRNTVYCQHCQR